MAGKEMGKGAIGGAMTGASVGGVPGAIIGGILGAYMAKDELSPEEARKKKLQDAFAFAQGIVGDQNQGSYMDITDRGAAWQGMRQQDPRSAYLADVMRQSRGR